MMLNKLTLKLTEDEQINFETKLFAVLLNLQVCFKCVQIHMFVSSPGSAYEQNLDYIHHFMGLVQKYVIVLQARYIESNIWWQAFHSL